MRLRDLRGILLFPLTFQILLSTRLIGSLDAWDDEELLNITLQRYEEGERWRDRQRDSERRKERSGTKRLGRCPGEEMDEQVKPSCMHPEGGQRDRWWTHEEGLSLGDWETGQVINKQIWTGDK